MISSLPLALASMTAIVVGWLDHRTGKMPNWIVGLSVTIALVHHAWASSAGGALHALAGLLCCGLAPAMLYFATKGDGIGGGDVKALMAIGAWLGPLPGLEAELFSLILLCMGAIVISLRQQQLGALLGRSVSLLGRSSKRRKLAGLPATPTITRTYVRFGPYFAVGVTVSCMNQFLLQLGVTSPPIL